MPGTTPPPPRRVRHLQAPAAGQAVGLAAAGQGAASSPAVLPPAAAPRGPAAADDPIGALLVRQARDGYAAEPGQGAVGGERVTDLAEIARVLNGCFATSEASDDDLVFELLMLEAMLSELPVRSAALLSELGELGEEVRDGLVPPGAIDVASLRRRTRRLRQHIGNLASRISAALVLFLTGGPMLAQEALAASDDTKGVTVANAPVVRVIDAVSFQAVAGVQIKTMDERLLGVTDASGNAVLGEGYLETDLLSLERDGYDMYLLDRSQLSSRNIVSMKPLKAAAVAAAPGARGAAGAAGRPSAPAPAGLRPPVAPRPPEPPRVAHGPTGHEPHVTPPRPPARPAAPAIKLPVRPRGKGAEGPAAPHHAAPSHATAGHAPARVAPHLQLPKAPVRVAHAAGHGASPAGAHGGHAAGDAHGVARPSKAVRLPVRPRSHGVAEGHHAATVPHLAAKPTLHGAPGAGSHRAAGHGAKAAHAGGGHRASHATPAHATAHRGISSPTLPRRPRGLHGAQAAGHHVEAPHVAIPHHLPRPRLAHGAGAGASHGGAYRVQPGDSLSAIAQRMLGSARRWPELYAANRDRVAHPARIQAGQMLVVPRAAARPSAAGRHQYRVRPGDCLYTIAASQLGNGARWQAIWAMNRGKVRDARRIFPGQVLTLPDA
ncbi:MAG: LysM domain-containing protein [Candidatus Sericytochromatia bacterium]|nr:LysM domain-containing protein [Candidatus Sericytochromatia bacterium]